jgi:hypothetical protein
MGEITMRKLIAGLLAVSSLTVALPAAAQVYDSERASRLDDAINARQDDGTLTSRDATDLRMQLRSVERLDRRYQDDGLTRWEVRDLNRRYNEISNEITDLSGE